ETLSNTGYDLTLVHFHGIDDVSHAFGPHTKEVYERVENTDKLVESLAELWNGKIIIVADHGQHTDHGSDEKGRKGTHGAFQASDLFIPFLMK
ncbi:MAG: alkaline phosphatase family protein, partial [Anaerovorax sp.]